MTLLSRYQQIAATTQNIVSTDIPQSVVGDFADLALKVKDAGIRSVVFDDSVIKPAYPDYDEIRSLVEDSLHPPAPGSSHRTGRTPPRARAATASDGSAAGHVGERTDLPGGQRDRRLRLRPGPAQKALDEGEPPTKRG